MASTDAHPGPTKNAAYRVTFPIFDADGDLVTGAAGLDSEVSKDAGTFADCTNEATEIATSSGMYYLDLTSTEMNADTVAIIVKTSTTGAKTTPIVLYPAEEGDFSAVAGAVWNADATSYQTSGTFGRAIGDPGADSDTIWALANSNLDAAVSSRLAPTTAGRTLDVTTGGCAGIDWANVEAPTTTVGLSGTTVKTATDVETDTANIQTRIPTALVSGRIDASVGAMATDVITSGAVAASAVTEITSGLATSSNVTTSQGVITALLPAALVGGRIDASVGAVAANAITAAAIADGAIDAATFAADAITAAAIATGAITADAVADGAIDAGALTADAVDKIIDEVIEDTLTMRQVLRLVLSACAGKASGGGTSTMIYRDSADTTDRITATVDGDGNRTAVTLDVA